MFPDLYWAQRSNATEAEKNFIYLTVKVTDLVEDKFDITDSSFEFKGTAQSGEYQVKFDFFEDIDASKTKQSKTGQGITLQLFKKNAQEEYWPRLTKNKVKLPWLHTDFDKWVDEDEQDEAPEVPDMGDMGMGGGMGGAGGAGGMDMAQMAQLQQMLGGMGGGAGGAGGAGGLDMASLMSQMGGAGALGGEGAQDDATEIEEADEEAPEEAE